MWVPDFDSVGEWLDHVETLCSAQQEEPSPFPQWLCHPASHQQCGRVPVSPRLCQHLLLFSLFGFLFIKEVLGVRLRQHFTVADSISPVLLVFLFSPDPVLRLFPQSTHTYPNWLPAPGRVSSESGQAAQVGYPTFGCWEYYFVPFGLCWLGQALHWHLGCSSASLSFVPPTGCRLLALSCHPFGGYSFHAGCVRTLDSGTEHLLLTSRTGIAPLGYCRR